MDVSTASRNSVLAQLSGEQKLLAVSKLQSTEKILALFNEGQVDFAENYIQEALEKISRLHHLSIRWHLIGPIQSNKVKLLKKNFFCIHSIDSLKLAEKISQAAEAISHRQKIFLQVNLSGEDSKSGFNKVELLRCWPDLLRLGGVQVDGLMTMPPLENEPEKNRIFFKELKSIGNQLNLNEFSMGTSHDYQIALQEGATWIRLGTMLFGERPQKRG